MVVVGLWFASERLHPGLGGVLVVGLFLWTLVCLTTPVPAIVHAGESPCPE